MKQFEKLVDHLIDCEIRMMYYNPEIEEILMQGDKESIMEVIKLTEECLESGFSFRITHVLDDWYHIFIYNQPDVDRGIVEEMKRLETQFKYYLELIDSEK